MAVIRTARADESIGVGGAVSTSDVAVIGGGPAGVCAAVAAARTGAEVILLERAGFLGGTATGAMVAAFNGFYWNDVRVTDGIAGEIVERLEVAGGTNGIRDYVGGALTDAPFSYKVLPFDPEILKFVLDDLVAEAGVRVIHHAQGISAHPDREGHVDVDFLGPVSLGRIRAAQIVDATGHGTVAAGAGAELHDPGRDERQPMTLMMRVSGVNRDEVKALSQERKREIVHRGVDEGRLFYRTLATSTSPRNGDVFLLMTSVHGRDGADAWGLSEAEREGRRQARSTLDFLRQEMPGYENAQLAQLAPWIGVRETQRIVGIETLSAQEVWHGADRADAISYGAGPIDLHEGDGVRLTAPARPFAVPMGVLVPSGVRNMTVTGRASSAEPGAMDGLRHMGGVMPLGHAAGVLAALAARDGETPAGVDVHEVRDVLRSQGAIVDCPVGAMGRV